MLIREFTDTDWPRVWEIVAGVVRAGDTFTYDPAMTREQAYDVWVERTSCTARSDYSRQPSGLLNDSREMPDPVRGQSPNRLSCRCAKR